MIKKIFEISGPVIYINGKREGSVYYTFPKEGINVIKYVFHTTFRSTSCMFLDVAALRSIDLSHFNSENVVYMDKMFLGCTSLISINFGNFSTKM